MTSPQMTENPWASCALCGERWLRRSLINKLCPWCRVPGPRPCPPLAPDPAFIWPKPFPPLRREARCLVCGRFFPTARAHVKTCGANCRQRLQRIRHREQRRGVTVECAACYRPFIPHRQDHVYYSGRCRNWSWKSDEFLFHLMERMHREYVAHQKHEKV